MGKCVAFPKIWNFHSDRFFFFPPFRRPPFPPNVYSSSGALLRFARKSKTTRYIIRISFPSERLIDRFSRYSKKKKNGEKFSTSPEKLRTRLGKFVRINVYYFNVYYTSSYWSFIPLLLHKSNSYEISHSVSKDETANYWSIFIVRFLKFRKLYFL